MGLITRGSNELRTAGRALVTLRKVDALEWLLVRDSDLVPEVHAVLDAFVSTRRALLLSTLTPPQRTVADESLTTLLEHAKTSAAPVKRGLFKHAKVAAAKHQYGTSSRPEVFVMECPRVRLLRG